MSEDNENEIRVEFAFLTDENGFVGRQCPQDDCRRYFKIKPGTESLSGKSEVICSYCGNGGDHSNFWTDAQKEYAQSIAVRKATELLQSAFQQNYRCDHGESL